MPPELPLPSLPPRPATGHKGTFGTVAVVGGSSAGDSRMIGAPALAATAALRAGCGLVRLAMPGPILSAGIVTTPPAAGTRLGVDGEGNNVAHQGSAAIY